jgi:hypothetical protein
MKQTFKLKKGEISFDADKIIIKDDAKRQKWILSLILFLGTIYGILTLLRYFKTGDQSELWTGLFIFLLNLFGLTLWLLRSVRNEISLSEVRSIKLNQKFSNKFLDIRLNSNRLRRVVRVDNETKLEEYIETNFKTKLNYGC